MIANKNIKLLNDFARLYYNIVPRDQSWFGIPIQKCPLDMWIYHEIIFGTLPDFIIETGTYQGGSAFYISLLCDILDRGQVITIDIAPGKNLVNHPRIEYITGSSTDPKIVKIIKNKVKDKKTMVILDSDHHEEHVTNELRLYSPLVSTGCYLIVEDTLINQPQRAVKKFLKNNDEFVIDTMREKFLLTFNPGGYLRKAY